MSLNPDALSPEEVRAVRTLIKPPPPGYTIQIASTAVTMILPAMWRVLADRYPAVFMVCERLSYNVYRLKFQSKTHIWNQDATKGYDTPEADAMALAVIKYLCRCFPADDIRVGLAFNTGANGPELLWSASDGRLTYGLSGDLIRPVLRLAVEKLGGL